MRSVIYATGIRTRKTSQYLGVRVSRLGLFALGFALTGALAADTKPPTAAQTVRVSSDYLTAEVSLAYPGFTGLSLDSLGKEHFPMVTIQRPREARPATGVQTNGDRVEYRRPGAASWRQPRWSIGVGEKDIRLESHWSAEDPPEPLAFDFDNSVSHVTLLGKMQADGSIQLPAILHFPDQGSFRISETASNTPTPTLAYATSSGDLGSNQAKVVRVIFPPATADKPTVSYLWEVVTIHPDVEGLDTDARFDGFRRNWLNILQLAPRWRALANHAASDTCAFCYYEYADIATRTPQLATDFNALDMVRQTLDRIIGGANAYGMPGHGDFPEFSADTYPSLLLAACACARAVCGPSDNWVDVNYPHFKAWADKMLGTVHNRDGLIEYSLSGNAGSWPEKLRYRPANWWDTIGFGHQDAYANALAYRAFNEMAEVAAKLNHTEDELKYRFAANKIHSTYFKAFFNPTNGVLAGWRSADGQLHDYYFLWVNGIAIHYGLVPTDKANGIMTRLLSKMNEVGFNHFELGLPGNLVPVALKDYVDHNPRFGGGHPEDKVDAFQRYENGGATACFAYFTLAALYDLGRTRDADLILFPMLKAFARGDFQGRGDNGMSKDWKAWDGTCWGYEGFLTDNYYTLLAVLDRQAALKR